MKEYVSPGVVEIAISETAQVVCWTPASPVLNEKKENRLGGFLTKEKTRKIPNIFDYLPSFVLAK